MTKARALQGEVISTVAGRKAQLSPAAVEITSPWSSRAFVTQRRRWSWGTLLALPHLPRAAALRVIAFYVITLGAFALSVYGAIDTLATGRAIGGPWVLALGAWLGLFGLAGWIGSSGRPSQALLAIVLAWPSAIVNALIVPFSILLGPPRRFRTIRKLRPERNGRAEPLLRAFRAPVIAAAAALLIAPAAASMATTLGNASAGPPAWGELGTRPLGKVTTGVLRAGDEAGPGIVGAVGSRPDLRRAITVMVYGNDPRFREKTDRLLNQLSGLGVTGVSMTVPIFTSGLRANSVHTDAELTPSPRRILAFANAAHLRGMTVTLSPLLDERVLVEEGGWRGKLQPSDRDAWFHSYAKLAGRFAGLASRGGFEGLNVGTEFESLSLDHRWRSVLETVRKRYDGTVSYAMAGSRVLDPRFGYLLRNVDVVGINTWYQLALPDGASTGQISRALQPWVEDVNAFQAKLRKPLIITEAGGRSRAGAYRHQVRDAPQKPLDMKAQSRVYKAICGFGADVGAGGIIWWATTPDPPAEPRADRGFEPLGKPAERQIRKCGPPNPR